VILVVENHIGVSLQAEVVRSPPLSVRVGGPDRLVLPVMSAVGYDVSVFLDCEFAVAILKKVGVVMAADMVPCL